MSISKSKLLKLSRMLYAEMFMLVVFVFLSAPMWLYPVMVLFHIPSFFKIRTKGWNTLHSIFYVVALTMLGIISSSAVRMFIVSVISYIVIFCVKYGKKEKSAREYVQGALTLAFPFLTMYIVEFMQRNVGYLTLYIFDGVNCTINHYIICGTVVFLWALFFFIKVMSKSYILAYLVVNIPIFIAGFVNMIVFYLTMMPFSPKDIFTFGTAMNVIGEQTITPELVVLILLSLVMIVLYMFIGIKVYKSKKPRAVKAKFAKGVGLIILIILMVRFLWAIDLLNFNANIKLGYICYFVNELQGELKEPEGYEEQSISTSLNNVDTNSVKPNVIIVMSEAFSDLSATYDLETSEDYIPYFHELQKQYPGGVVYSSILGNNTCSSEVESITGISTGFTVKGANVFQRYIESLDNFYSIGSYYQDIGYVSGFFHPCAANNYNRLKAYEVMGYDFALFLEDMEEDTDKFRTFVTDEEDYDKVVSLVKDTEEPLFLMNITMQNHGSYGDEFEISPYIEITNSKGDYVEVERYLSLLRKSDDCLKEFLGELEKSGEPTVVLFFGDHQPMVTKDFYSEYLGGDYYDLGAEDRKQTYEVPYLIWSNCEVRGDYDLPSVTSMNYLSLILNNYLGNENTEWLKLLDDVRGYYPVITENFVIDKDGNFRTMNDMQRVIMDSDGSDEGLELLKKYWYCCYTLIQKGVM